MRFTAANEPTVACPFCRGRGWKRDWIATFVATLVTPFDIIREWKEAPPKRGHSITKDSCSFCIGEGTVTRSRLTWAYGY